MGKKKPFVIAHLSDLHLTPNNSVGRTEVSLPGKNLHGMNNTFERVLSSDEIKSAELILVTGDVTDQGDKASWKVFYKALNRAGVAKKTLVVPGNHDVCDMSLFSSPADFIKAVTGKKRKENLHRLKANLKSIGQPITYPWAKIVDKVDRRVMILGLDSNNSGNFGPADNAVGKIGERQLEKLDKILQKHSDRNDTANYIPVRIIALHHSPNLSRYDTLVRRGIIKERWIGDRLFRRWDGLFTRWTHQIPQNDRRQLRELCVKHRVRLIAHGHMHEAEDRRVNGIRHIGTPATTQPTKRTKNRFRFYRYTIFGEGGTLKPELVTLKID